MVRTRWEGYGDPPTFRADDSWKAASSLDTVSWLSVLSGTSSAGSTEGGRDHLRSRPSDRSKDHSLLESHRQLPPPQTGDGRPPLPLQPLRRNPRSLCVRERYETLEFSRELADDGEYLWESAASGSDVRSDIRSPTTPPSARSVESIQQETIPGGGSVLPRRRDFRRVARLDNRCDSHDIPTSQYPISRHSRGRITLDSARDFDLSCHVAESMGPLLLPGSSH